MTAFLSYLVKDGCNEDCALSTGDPQDGGDVLLPAVAEGGQRVVGHEGVCGLGVDGGPELVGASPFKLGSDRGLHYATQQTELLGLLDQLLVGKGLQQIVEYFLSYSCNFR